LLVALLSVGSMNNGQSNVLVIGLLMAAVAAVTEERWNLASICVAVACLFKVYPIAVGLLLAVVYPRRFGLRLALVLGIGLVLPFLLQNPSYVSHQYAAWIDHMRSDDRQTRPLSLWYRDLRLVSAVWFRPMSAIAYQAIQFLTAAGIATLCWLGSRRWWSQRRLLTSLLAMGCCWMTVLGPATDSATYTLLAPVLAWAVLEALLEKRGLIVRGLLLVSYGLFLSYYMAHWFPWTAPFRNLGPQPVGGLILLGTLVWTALYHLVTEEWSSAVSLPAPMERAANPCQSQVA
jgi:hypothetical protein